VIHLEGAGDDLPYYPALSRLGRRYPGTGSIVNCGISCQRLGPSPHASSTGMPDPLKTLVGADLSLLLGLDCATRCARLTASPLVKMGGIG